MIITKEIREIFGQASLAGITNESIGTELRIAALYERQGNKEGEIRSLNRALDIHNTWGSKVPEVYGMHPKVLENTMKRLSDLKAKSAKKFLVLDGDGYELARYDDKQEAKEAVRALKAEDPSYKNVFIKEKTT